MFDNEERMRMSFWPSIDRRLADARHVPVGPLTLTASHTQQSIQTVGYSCYNYTSLVCSRMYHTLELTIPLESLLQPKELAKGKIV